MFFKKVSKEQFIKDYESAATADERFSQSMIGISVDAVYDKIKLPQRATKLSAGYDFFSPVPFTLSAGDSIKIPTGIQISLDDDKYLAIYPRSGLGFKYKLQLWNTCGIIDADYILAENEGHIWVKLCNDCPEDKMLDIQQGEAFCQGIIQQYFMVDGDKSDAVRTGGFGSTTK